MNAPWAMRIPLANAPAAGVLRCTASVEALVEADALWLRGESLTDTLGALLRQVPGERFTRAPGELLIPVGRKLPVRALPAGKWVPVEHALVLKAPASLTPAGAARRVPLRLVPAHIEAAPNLLVAERPHWSKWVETAAPIRLRPLAFALSESQVIIRGTPVPNLPGTRYVEAAGVAVPCGYRVSPALSPATLAQVLGLGQGDVALLHPDPTCEVLPAEVFVPASRGAVRLSDAGRPA